MMFKTSRIPYLALKLIDISEPLKSILTFSVPIDLSLPNELTTQLFPEIENFTVLNFSSEIAETLSIV